MTVYLYVNPDGVVDGWGSAYSEGMVEINLDPSDPMLANIGTMRYFEGRLVEAEDIILENCKQAKDLELNEACKQSILAGFSHTINGVLYWFSYDAEAQGNFRDAKDALEDGIVTEVPWTVRIGGIDGEYTRIPVNMEIMSELRMARLYHAQGKISKYRDFLMPIVKDAQETEEVEAVKW